MTSAVKQQKQTCIYNGQIATVVATTPNSNFITIEVNGVKFFVNKNDLFGMNIRNEVNEYYEEQIANCDEQIARNAQIIEENEDLWTKCSKSIKEFIKMMAQILSDSGVSDYKELTDENQKVKYANLVTQKRGTRSSQLRASADIISAANDTVSCASHKRNLVNQQYVSNYLV